MSNLQKNLHIVRSLQNFTSFFTYNHQFLYMVSKHKHCSFFLMHDINLFLPIEKVCSKLNFPPAPEAERNRQCGSAGWSAEAVFDSPMLQLVVRFGHVFRLYQKVSQHCTLREGSFASL